MDAILESTLRDIINFRRLSDRLITGGQPTEAELALAAAAGAEVVINLGRLDPAYALPDERGTVAALGLIYEHIPVVWAEPTAADLDAFFAAMARHAGRRLSSIARQTIARRLSTCSIACSGWAGGSRTRGLTWMPSGIRPNIRNGRRSSRPR